MECNSSLMLYWGLLQPPGVKRYLTEEWKTGRVHRKKEGMGYTVRYVTACCGRLRYSASEALCRSSATGFSFLHCLFML